MSSLPLLEDACAALPHARRAMFGGHGFFAPNGGMFAAIVDEDRIALKLEDEAAARELREEGGEPWTYQGRTTMSHWYVVPDALYDSPPRLAEWARRAHALVKPPRRKAAAKAKAAKAGGTGSSRRTRS